jgi:hypothetical protein
MSHKDKKENFIRNSTAAELLAVGAEGGGDTELALRFADLATQLDAVAEQQAGLHEEEVRGTTAQMAINLEQALRFSSTPSLYEDKAESLLEARSTDAVEEGIMRFYRALGLEAAAEAAPAKTHNMVIGVGATARRLAEKGVISPGSTLHRRSRDDRDPAVWRMSRKTIDTGLGFSLRETRYSSSSRRVTRKPDVVEVDAVFPKRKKNR